MQMQLNTIDIVAHADPAWAGGWLANLTTCGRLVTASRKPFTAAARRLIEENFDPNATLSMRYADGKVGPSMPLGEAAKLDQEPA